MSKIFQQLKKLPKRQRPIVNNIIVAKSPSIKPIIIIIAIATATISYYFLQNKPVTNASINVVATTTNTAAVANKDYDKITSILYMADDSKTSLVTINGKVYRQGDNLDSYRKLIAIQPKYIIIKQGQKQLRILP